MYSRLRYLFSSLLGLPPSLHSCRFLPTCHHYCKESLSRHGLFRGGWLCLWRVIRCSPFSRGGYDPVP